MEPGGLSIEDVAQRLGVHYMTVYRYIRVGRLPAEQRGGRWVIRPEDLGGLGRPARRHRTGTGRSDPAASAGGPSGRMLDRLLAGDGPGAWAIVEDALLTRPPVAVYTEVIGPALRTLGDGWANGRLSVAQEHRATAVALGIVGRLGPLFRRRGRRRPRPVILAGVERDSHAIPLMMVADMLNAGGFEVIHLGADVPVSTLVPFAAATRDLGAVGLSASTDESARHATLAITAVKEQVGPVPVVLGGPAVPSEAAARALGADGWAADAAGALGVVLGLTGGTP